MCGWLKNKRADCHPTGWKVRGPTRRWLMHYGGFVTWCFETPWISVRRTTCSMLVSEPLFPLRLWDRKRITLTKSVYFVLSFWKFVHVKGFCWSWFCCCFCTQNSEKNIVSAILLMGHSTMIVFMLSWLKCEDGSLLIYLLWKIYCNMLCLRCITGTLLQQISFATEDETNMSTTSSIFLKPRGKMEPALMFWL